MKVEKRGEFFKADGKVIYGWALVCETKNASGEWEPYVDTQGDHIPSDVATEAALDFAKHSRVGKDMHTGDQVGSVPLVYVLTKASDTLGIVSDKTGVLIGWEPTDPTLLDAVARGERTGFSIGGFVEESDSGTAKAIRKSADDEEPDLATKLGARVFRRFKISEISLVDRPAMTPALIAYVKRDSDEEKVSPTRTITVAPSAHQKSTRLTQTKESAAMTLDEALAEIEDLKAKLAEKAEEKDDAEKRADLTDAQKAHLATLGKGDAKAFLAKSAADRNLEIAKALESNPVEFTCADGTEIRKSHGPLMLKLAKQADEALKAAQVEKAAREETELRKRATDTIGALAGKDEVHMALLKSVEGIADEKVRTDAIATLKAANMAMATKSVAPGANDGSEPSHKAPQGELDALVAKHMAEHKVDKTAATAAVLNTPDGARLYGAIVKALRK